MALAPSAEMPPLWPLDRRHLDQLDYCWRCDTSDLVLRHDPMMPPGDPIKVCTACAIEREQVRDRYFDLGTEIQPVRRP